MPVNVVMPKLDRFITQGTIMEWRVRDGDSVEKGEILAVVETEKATFEVEAPVSGIFHKKAPVGSTVPVNQVIAFILQPGEEIPSSMRGEIEKPIRATPLARKLAMEYSIDLFKVTGTGPGGRVTKKDVLSYAEGLKFPPKVIEEREETIPLIGWRKTMAERMSYSARTAAQLTTIAEVDATELVKLHEKLEEPGIRVSYTVFIVKATAQALQEYPIINSSLVDDKILVKKYCNIGIAVAREDKGLIVPVVRNAEEKNLMETAKEVEELIKRAREDRLTPKDVKGGTFTITNPGMLGVIIDTPIINPPESAILGVGAIVRRPVIINNEITIRSMMYLCLTYDHRVIDGVPAIRFLQRVKYLLENPHTLLNAEAGGRPS